MSWTGTRSNAIRRSPRPIAPSDAGTRRGVLAVFAGAVRAARRRRRADRAAGPRRSRRQSDPVRAVDRGAARARTRCATGSPRRRKRSPRRKRRRPRHPRAAPAARRPPPTAISGRCGGALLRLELAAERQVQRRLAAALPRKPCRTRRSASGDRLSAALANLARCLGAESEFAGGRRAAPRCRGC